ncbi:MAG: hypothetical protein KGN02_11730, partial [bacterium]|nr:hypothetical protein [bacterium]
MKKFGLVLFAFALALALGSQARAIQIPVATKQISLSFLITPSPIVYVPNSANGAVREVALTARQAAAGLAFDASSQLARAGDAVLAYDPISLGDMVAQSNPQGSAKVQFTVKVDPTFVYFHIVPG